MINISGEMAAYWSPLSCTQMLFSCRWRKRMEITTDRIKGGKWDILNEFCFQRLSFATCAASQTSASQKEELWSVEKAMFCEIWRSLTCASGFWSDSARWDPLKAAGTSTEFNVLRLHIMRPRVWNSVHFSSKSSRVCWEWKTMMDGGMMDGFWSLNRCHFSHGWMDG